MYLRISNSSNMLHHTVSANTSCLTQNFPKLIRTRYLSQLPAHKSFWNWTTQVRPSWRQSYKEAAIIFTVFGITGSSSLFFVRPALKYTIGLEVLCCHYYCFYCFLVLCDHVANVWHI